MPSTYDAANRTVVERLMVDPEWAQVIAECLARLREGFYPQHVVDAIFQKWVARPLDLYDAYAFSQVWVLISSGAATFSTTYVGQTPCADAQVEEMNRRLSGIDAPFKARFWGGTQDEDGYVECTEPITLINRCEPLGPDGLQPEEEVRVEIRAGTSFPLEVGYNAAAKTLFALLSNRRLARWPYGSEWIYLFAMRPMQPVS